MRHAAILLLPLLLGLPTAPALAGAWVLPRGAGKATLSHIRHDQRVDLQVNDLSLSADLQETDTGLLLETGLTDRVTLTAKANDARFAFVGPRQQTESAAVGLTLDTPLLAVGLLPPFMFRLADRALPRARLRREKRASLSFAALYRQGPRDRTGHTTTLALADKISAGRLSVVQEVETATNRIDGMQEVTALYRFSLGYGAVELGTQVEQFDNGGLFLALSHSHRLAWKPQTADWQVTLGRGQRRIAQPYLPGARIHRGRVWLLEIQRKF